MICLTAVEATSAWWVAPGIIAAVIAAAVALFTLGTQARRSRLDRQRVLFADAHAAIAEYCEYPYIIRRRGPGTDERARISTEMSDVQHRLLRYQAMVAVESPRIVRYFDDLVSEARRIAGAACHDSWERAVLAPDEPANIADIDLAGIDPARSAYLRAIRIHLNPVRGRLRRG